MSDTIKIEGEVEEFLRRSLDERLAQLPQNQLEFFNRIWDGHMKNGVIPASSLKDCIDLCDRSIRKNNADASRMLKHTNEQCSECGKALIDGVCPSCKSAYNDSGMEPEL